MKAVAIGGSRKAPRDVLTLMGRTAQHLAKRGVQVRTGPLTAGPDRIARSAVYRLGLNNAFGYGISSMAFDAPGGVLCGNFPLCHWSSCRRYVADWPALERDEKEWWVAAHVQLTGRNSKEPARFALVWTPDGATRADQVSTDTGHTARLILLAELNQITLFNLAVSAHRQRFEALI